MIFLFVAVVIFFYCLHKLLPLCFQYEQSKTVLPYCVTKGFRYDQRFLEMGKQHFLSSGVIICCMLRDAEKIITNVRGRLTTLHQHFKNYRLLIVENDSRDNTRERLLEWQAQDSNLTILGCGENQLVCNYDMMKTRGHAHCSQRITKMASLRNIYLDYIAQKIDHTKYQYTIVLDGDLEGMIYPEGLYDTANLFMRDESIDAVACNGWSATMKQWCLKFFDPYAFEFHPSSAQRTLSYWEERMPFLFHLLRYRFVRYNAKPLKVLSAFNGLAIYRTKSVVKYRYDSGLASHGRPRCEHKYLHEKMNMLFNPKFFFLIYANPVL